MLSPTEKESVLYGKFLYFFAAYTVTIKYLLPVAWAVIRQVPLNAYIYFWDAWWICHIAVGLGLDYRKKGIWIWAFFLAVAEIIIIVVKFAYYLASPGIDFWHLNWFVNKTLLLCYFFLLLIWLFKEETKALLR